MDSAPQVQYVARRSARWVKAPKDVLAQMHRERTCAIPLRAVNRTRPAALDVATQTAEVSQMPQDLLYRHLTAEPGEVDRTGLLLARGLVGHNDRGRGDRLPFRGDPRSA